MPSRLSPGASGALRRFAGWVARGSVGHPLLEGIDYWPELADSPSQLETLFAIFANVLELDDLRDRGRRSAEKSRPTRRSGWSFVSSRGRSSNLIGGSAH